MFYALSNTQNMSVGIKLMRMLKILFFNTSCHDFLDVVGGKRKYKECIIYVYFKTLKITVLDLFFHDILAF